MKFSKTKVGAFLIGAALGGVVFGWLGDKIGRVRAMAASILIYSLFTGCIYFAQEPWHLAAFRFLAALGMGGEWSLGVALVMEVWPEKHRPLMAGIIGAAANVGFALIAVVTIFFKVTVDSWRWVALVGAAPALLTFVIRLFVPESEKWQHAVTTRKTPNQPLREIFGPGLLKYTLLATALVGAFTAAFYGWLPLYLPELFPTRMRATGQGLAFNAGRILAAAGAVYGGQLVQAFEGSYARAGAIITLVYVVGMVIIWFAPETKGKPLPD